MSRLADREPECASDSGPLIDLVIEGRPRDIGGLAVRRVLPSARRRLVGPFIFVDHMGPASFAPGEGLDVRPHPHIALATLTYLFDGELLHRDSLGTEQRIVPGAVNWMIAGQGITHSERTPPDLRVHGTALHGLQTWVALPIEHEHTTPRFEHHHASTLPTARFDGAFVRVLAGEAYGKAAPTSLLSPTFFVHAELEQGAVLPIEVPYEERALYVARGEVRCEGKPFQEGTMLVFRRGATVTVSAESRASVVLLGGAPLDGPRHIWWNFVSSSKQTLELAKVDWREGRFPKVPGDDVEFIPLPEA